MNRLRRSIRDGFRSKRSMSTSARSHQWANDEAAVKNGICSFHVKYLGCAQVYESRGMHICEDALRLLKSQRRRAVRSVLFITGDGLRVVDDETKDLLVDQTIEKVSFCAPDRSSERGFSYICRDGTTRRWMCHGFIATRDSEPDQLVTGERLSHAVGCAFALCLEKKQKRDAERAASMAIDPGSSSFRGFVNFRQGSIADRLTDPQECKPAEVVPVKPVTNPFAVDRPHAPYNILERQGSLRVQGRDRLAEVSPFKRQLSLGSEDLPVTPEKGRDDCTAVTTDAEPEERPPPARGRLMSLPSAGIGQADQVQDNDRTGDAPPDRRRQMSLACGSLFDMAPIAEAAPTSEQEPNVTPLLYNELSEGGNRLDSIQQGPSAAGSTPCPDDWLESLTRGSSVCRPAVPRRHGRSPSLATDALISGSPWPQLDRGTAPAATNPFIGETTVKTFQMQM